MAKVTIVLSPLNGNSPVYKSTIFTGQNGTFSQSIIPPGETGKYNLSVLTHTDGKTEIASKELEITTLFGSISFLFLILTVGFLAGLTILVFKGIGDYQQSEVLRFVCITGIVFCIVASFCTNRVSSWLCVTHRIGN